MQRILLILGLAMVIAAPTAYGQTKTDEAKTYFQAGVQAYEKGQFQAAAAAFEQAYALVPKVEIVFSMAQAYRRYYFTARDPAALSKALALYRQYLRDAPQGSRRNDAVQHLSNLEPIWLQMSEEQRRVGEARMNDSLGKPETQLMITSRIKTARATINGIDPEEVPVVRVVKPGKHQVEVKAEGYFTEKVEAVAVDSRLIVVPVELKAKPALLQFRGEQGAQVRIDGRVVGEMPMKSAVKVEAGRHLIAVGKRGRTPYVTELDLSRGQSVDINANLQATGQRKASYWVLAGAGAIAIAGGVTTTMSIVRQGQANDILERRDSGNNISANELDEYNDRVDQRNSFRTASYLLYGGAIVLGTTGALMYFIDNPDAESRATTVTPVVGRKQAGVSVQGRF